MFSVKPQLDSDNQWCIELNSLTDYKFSLVHSICCIEKVHKINFEKIVIEFEPNSLIHKNQLVSLGLQLTGSPNDITNYGVENWRSSNTNYLPIDLLTNTFLISQIIVNNPHTNRTLDFKLISQWSDQTLSHVDKLKCYILLKTRCVCSVDSSL